MDIDRPLPIGAHAQKIISIAQRIHGSHSALHNRLEGISGYTLKFSEPGSVTSKEQEIIIAARCADIDVMAIEYERYRGARLLALGGHESSAKIYGLVINEQICLEENLGLEYLNAIERYDKFRLKIAKAERESISADEFDYKKSRAHREAVFIGPFLNAPMFFSDTYYHLYSKEGSLGLKGRPEIALCETRDSHQMITLPPFYIVDDESKQGKGYVSTSEILSFNDNLSKKFRSVSICLRPSFNEVTSREKVLMSIEAPQEELILILNMIESDLPDVLSPVHASANPFQNIITLPPAFARKKLVIGD